MLCSKNHFEHFLDPPTLNLNLKTEFIYKFLPVKVLKMPPCCVIHAVHLTMICVKM